MTTAAVPTVGVPAARFRDLIAAEWIKLWSLRSTAWMYAISALAVIAFNGGAAYDHYRYWYEYDVRSRAAFVSDGLALGDAFTTNAGMVLLLATGAIGAVAITGEYGSGLIRTTFTAVPARASVMAAKACVVTAVMTLFGAAVAGTSFGLTQAILSGRHAGVPFSHPGALRVVVASTLLSPLAALIGMALGVLLRRGAAAVIAVVVLLMVLPLAVSDGRYTTAVVAHAMPFEAWLRLVQAGDRPAAYPWTLTGAWTVYAVWALVAAAIAVVGVRRRDQ
ncbi:ABC transporter permease [Streptomyces sp. AK02-01A]|uniref:ABC transporter permease n=1 Tax=Streptomyces sp. AK02-01A TaxID=3028648 RepID=UPI0029B4F0B1|nr:ABC transporter permease [Streptomyces sp. AK02-01A]MDX3853613.1 ABC transporter permease [Streptomyces sp. AK02-01A]